MMRWVRAGCGLAIALVFTGCAGSPVDAVMSSAQIRVLAETERVAGNLEQADVLADGVVTPAEYDARFAALRECYEGFGYTVSDPMVNPVTNVRFEFSISAEGFEQESVFRNLETCEKKHWNSVSQAYERTQPERMDAALWQASRTCLGDVATSTAEEPGTLAELVSGARTEPEMVLDCVGEQAFALYPDLPALSTLYK